MISQSVTFTLITILILAVVLCIFAMKYFVAARVANDNEGKESEFKILAENTLQTQVEILASLKEIQTTSADLKSRVISIETVLREVD